MSLCACRRVAVSLLRAARPVAFVPFLFAAVACGGGDDASTVGSALPAEIRENAATLREAALRSTVGYETLARLCDEHGHRLTGSERLERAIDWMAGELRSMGFENVRKEPVQVPVWIRGDESLTLLEPMELDVPMLGLGMSVGTPPGGLTGEVVVVEDFDELEAMSVSEVSGRIVLFDAPYRGYGRTVPYRTQGAIAAAQRGAIAALVRSIGPPGLRTPHTGTMRYRDDTARIPAAAIATEDSDMIARLDASGRRVVVRLEMEARNAPDGLSHNLIAEVVGREKPEEVVVIGGHIDSWDVGTGAQDDGVGCLIAVDAARLMLETGLIPRRTVRVVLWTNEENGLRGARAYRDDHADELDRHVAAIESDSGNGIVQGFRFDFRPPVMGFETAEEGGEAFEAGRDRMMAMARDIAGLLETTGADSVFAAGSGADVGPLAARGVPALGLHHDTSDYFVIHHTEADTFDKIVLEDMQKNTAAMAVMAWVLAEMEGTLRP